MDQSVQSRVLPQRLPAGIDQSTVVVAAQTLLNTTTPSTNVPRPQVRLTWVPGCPISTG